jgi:uncharacterized protein (DUF2252 family)
MSEARFARSLNPVSPTEESSSQPQAGNGRVDSRTRGKRARELAPRSRHGRWEPAADRPDPVEVLERQAADRLEELVPIRYGRMLVSPFAFYRGAAAIMAADLAPTPTSGIRVQACGDAHLANFGGFAAPDRRLIFDINDFDETLPGPWEWDVKRLAASLEIAGRDREFGRKQRVIAVQSAATEYREQIRRLAKVGSLEAWYERVDLDLLRDRFADLAEEEAVASFDRNVAKARRKTSGRAFTKLARDVDGEIRIVSDPPMITPLDELLDAASLEQASAEIRRIFADYRATLPQNLRKLLDRFRLVDVARKVVGVGSVGTRAWIMLLLGRDHAEPLFLQIKEAQRSVLEPYTAKSIYARQGRRVVEGQRVMQAAGDILLGWTSAVGFDGKRRDFYVRQLWDAKGSARIDRLTPRGMAIYARLCGGVLANAHARSGDRVAIASYLGGGDHFDRAMVEFATRYAEQNERDYAALRAAAGSGRVRAELEVG